MKILIFSDTHKRVQPMLDIISRQNPDAVIHLGDYLSDIKEVMSAYPGLIYHFVLGNSDFGVMNDYEKIIQLGDKKVLLTHGHHYCVKNSLSKLICVAKSRGVDILMYGHTHIPKNEVDGSLYILNPGAISRPLRGKPTYAVAEIDDKIKINIMEY